MAAAEGHELAPPDVFHLQDDVAAEKIRAWIERIHPRCVEAFQALPAARYDNARVSACILAHLIRDHDATVGLLAEKGLVEIHHEHWDQGVEAAIAAHAERLLDDLMQNAENIESLAGSTDVARDILRVAQPASFERAFTLVWGTHGPPPFPRLALGALNAAGWTPVHHAHAQRLLDERPLDVYDAFPSIAVQFAMRASALTERRDPLLETFLDHDPLGAAKVIAAASNPCDLPRALLRATRTLLDRAPKARITCNAVAKCFDLDFDFAMPIAEEWVNRDREAKHAFDSRLSWAIRQHAARALPILAEGAIRSAGRSVQLLADLHHSRIENNDVIADWAEANYHRPEATAYVAKLMTEALSQLNDDDPTAARLRRVAVLLHKDHGKGCLAEYERDYNLKNSQLVGRLNLNALAQLRDVLDERRKLDPARFLATLKRYPRTYAALGGSAVDRNLAKGKFPTKAWLYDEDAEGKIRDLDNELAYGKITSDTHALLVHPYAWFIHERERWEHRFEAITAAGVPIPLDYSRRLREKDVMWNEMRLLARLVTKFKCTLEPTNVKGFGTKRLDFLLESEDGTLIFELVTIGKKPDDLRTCVKMGTGGEIKHALQRKFREQLGDGSTPPDYPLIVAVQSDDDLDDFGILNSLYGQFSVTCVIHKETGHIVSDGPSRKNKDAFFELPQIKHVSVIAGITGWDRPDGSIRGRLHRPLHEPRLPLSPKLWLRLRTALYGSLPEELIADMMRVPGMTREEAELLVNAGIDDNDFFAAGVLAKPPDLAMIAARWSELQVEARHKDTLIRTNAIADLRAAASVDLAPLHHAGIYLITQLYAKECPATFPQGAWDVLRDEADRYVGPPRESPLAAMPETDDAQDL